jgi:hypothetical protein
MKVVEEPVCSGRDELSRADIFGQDPVCAAEDTHVVLEARKRVVSTVPGVGIDREARGKSKRALFKAFDAQKLVAERFLDYGRQPSP